PPPPASPGLPPALLPPGPAGAPPPGPRKMGRANRPGTATRRERELVEEGFDREHVRVGTEGAQRRHPQRHLLDEMIHHALAREIVERDGVAVATARRLRDDTGRRRLLRLVEIPARQEIVAAGIRPR